MGAGLPPVTGVHQGPLDIYRLELVELGLLLIPVTQESAVPGNTFLNVLKMPFLAGVNS